MASKAKKKEADVWAEAVKKEPDPDKEFVKLVAGRTRWYRGVWIAILVGIAYLIMMTSNLPQPKPPIAPDFNPDGKQAAYQQVESWLAGTQPLGAHATIVSWDGSASVDVNDGKTPVKAIRHAMTVQGDDGRWWTVYSTIAAGAHPLGSPDTVPLSAPLNGDSGATSALQYGWDGTLGSYMPSSAATRLITQWANALYGDDSALLTTIVADPSPGAQYVALSLRGAKSVTVDTGAYLNRGKVARDKHSSSVAFSPQARG